MASNTTQSPNLNCVKGKLKLKVSIIRRYEILDGTMLPSVRYK